MAIFKLIEPNHWTLNVPIDQCSTDLDREEIARDLIETMKEYHGIGLSANQCGVMARVFVMYSDINKREIISCFNPKIISFSEEIVTMDEGCLTYPGLWLKVKRPESICCTFEDENGELNEVEMFGLESRVFQHEMDHMEGKNFISKVSKLRLDMAKKRAAKVLNRSKQRA